MDFLRKLFGCFFGGFLLWRIKPNTDQELQTADVVIALTHGFREEGHSPSNVAIAAIAHALAVRLELPVVLQHQVADCIHDASQDVVSVGKGAGCLNTHEVLLRMRVLCKKRGLHRAIIVAHSDPYWRVLRCAEKHGFDVFAVDTSSVPNDPQSKHPWTRSRWLLVPYDIIARLWFLVRSWI